MDGPELVKASQENDIERVKTILGQTNQRYDFETEKLGCGTYVNEAFMVAIQNRNLEIAKICHEYGVTPTSGNPGDINLYHSGFEIALEAEDYEIATWLVENRLIEEYWIEYMEEVYPSSNLELIHRIYVEKIKNARV